MSELQKQDDINTVEKESNINTAQSNISKIDAIKNLIFGEQIEAYEAEFKSLKSDIETKRQELENYISEVRTALFQQVEQLDKDLDQKITEINDNAEKLQKNKVDKDILGSMLIEIGERIKK